MPNYPQKKERGMSEARSRNPLTKRWTVSRHDTRERAEKRIAGNRRHDYKEVIDHTPPKN